MLRHIFISLMAVSLVAAVPALAHAEDVACAASAAAFRHILGDIRPGTGWLRTGAPRRYGPFRVNADALTNPTGGDPEYPHPGWRIPGERDEGRFAEPPSRSLAERFVRTAPVTGADCRAVRSVARDWKVIVAPIPYTPPRRKHDRQRFRFTYIEIGQAVVSADGREALVYGSTSSGPRAGGGLLLLLRRNAVGAWSVAGSLGVWIS